MTGPITVAGPAFARVVTAHGLPDEPDRRAFRVVTLPEGAVRVTWSGMEEDPVIVATGTALAVNLRGLLLAVEAGDVR